MFKSLRWKLQFFYSALLATVILCSGSIFYYQVWRSTFTEVDRRLEASALYLDVMLRSFPPPVQQGIEATLMPPPPLRPDGTAPPPPRPRRSKEQFLEELRLPQELNIPGINNPRDQPYFMVMTANDMLLKKEYLPQGYFEEDSLAKKFYPQPTLIMLKNNLREVRMIGPGGTKIIAGKSLEYEIVRMRYIAIQFTLVGIVFLVFGVGVSFAIASRMVRPITQMSATAELLSEKDLGKRLNINQIDSELAGLAEVLNRLFSRLDASFSRQRQFTADASHELRTPLTVIRSASELALSQPRSPEEYQETIEVSLKAAERMTNLVNGLLALARLDSSNADFHLQQINLSDLVGESVSLLGAIASEKQISLVSDLHAVQIFGNPESLSRMIDNLITNAILYNKPGGKVFITLSKSDNKAVLEIKDTGVGISEEHHPFIFERFYRVDKARSRLSGGSGLGLAICKGVIEKHNGTITAQSVLGMGTTFQIQLPVWKDSI
ncbi:MAG: HAMP domain-containing sensor histidine kinase [Planctomycetota bacterium]|nr:HAMP domain-containing sensor histidine kinase [Planctomycetota bacterium]